MSQREQKEIQNKIKTLSQKRNELNKEIGNLKLKLSQMTLKGSNVSTESPNFGDNSTFMNEAFNYRNDDDDENEEEQNQSDGEEFFSQRKYETDLNYTPEEENADEDDDDDDNNVNSDVESRDTGTLTDTHLEDDAVSSAFKKLSEDVRSKIQLTVLIIVNRFNDVKNKWVTNYKHYQSILGDMDAKKMSSKYSYYKTKKEDSKPGKLFESINNEVDDMYNKNKKIFDNYDPIEIYNLICRKYNL